jgi:ATP-binding cassette, subfamily B, bacterial HlyB/CyaB
MQAEQDSNSSLAALIRVASDHGIDLTIEAIRSSYASVGDDISTTMLISIANDAGLDAKCLRPKWRDLPSLGKVLPVIVRLKDGGAAILRSVGTTPDVGQVVLIEDPSGSEGNEVMLDEAHLAELWSGEIILLKRRHSFADEEQPFGFPWLIGQVLRERRLFREIAIASIVSTFLTLVPVFTVMIVLDRVMVNHSVSTLVVLGGAIGLVIVFEVALTYLRRQFIEVTATRIDGRLNLYLMRKLLALPMEYFERNPVGMTMGRLGGIWKVRNFLTGQLFSTLIDATMLVIFVPILLWLQWQLAILVFVLSGIIFLVIYLFLPRLGHLFAKIVQAENLKGTFLTETVYGMRTIKSLALEGRRLRDWDQRVAQSISARYQFGATANYPQTMTLPFERLIYSGSILLGAVGALEHPDVFLPGTIMAFGMLASRTAQPLVQLAKLLQDFGDIRGAMYEAAAVLNHPPEQGRIGSGLHLPVYGNISFQNVDFRYGAGGPLALNDVSIDIRPGTIFGIMGRSGSGKTTITRLLQGLNPKYEGIIKIDGMDLREMDLRHLRTNVGVVAQENFLFTGTIRENIGIARPNATFPEIVRAAQLAGAEEFIERLPRGYDTFLEEGGSNLSGGQRQRLAIARALVVDPPVLILDEATSALDAESEAIINANLLRIAQSRTIICVSHRLAMLVPADAILVMERGKVYDIGTHQELLHRCDIYKHMWYTQNRHTQPETPHALRSITLSSAG